MGRTEILAHDPGRYSLAETFYLNQQDMLHQIDSWDPELCRKPFPYGPEGFAEEDLAKASEVAGRELTVDELGFFFDRDVLAFYGDPAWNVRLKELPEENDFTVTASNEGGQYVLTVTTSENFSAERMAGSHFKEEHVKDLPFSYFFPERLKNPRLAEGETWDAAVDENFLLIYNPGSNRAGATRSGSTPTNSKGRHTGCRNEIRRAAFHDGKPLSFILLHATGPPGRYPESQRVRQRRRTKAAPRTLPAGQISTMPLRMA